MQLPQPIIPRRWRWRALCRETIFGKIHCLLPNGILITIDWLDYFALGGGGGELRGFGSIYSGVRERERGRGGEGEREREREERVYKKENM